VPKVNFIETMASLETSSEDLQTVVKNEINLKWWRSQTRIETNHRIKNALGWKRPLEVIQSTPLQRAGISST